MSDSRRKPARTLPIPTADCIACHKHDIGSSDLQWTTGDEFTVYVRPELVVEIAFDGVQTSKRYPGGVALRFARVKGYRPDKRPEEADTIDAVRAIHEGTDI